MGKRVGGLAVFGAVVVGLVAPGGAADTSASEVVSAVPPGTVLRVGDQFGLLQAVIDLAGADEDLTYEIEFATLLPGSVQLQAFRAGEIDAGALSSLALIQAGAGELGLRAVTRWRTDFALTTLVTAPGVDDVAGWADVEGRRLAFQRGTTAEAAAMLALDAIGLTLDDVTVVDVPVLQLETVMARGDADVAVMGEPFATGYLADNPTATYVLGVDDPIAESSLIVASPDALDDPALSAALGDFVTRLDLAFTELTSDPDDFADLVVAVWGLDRDYVERVIAESSGVELSEVPGDLLEPAGRLIEMLVAGGDIPPDLVDVDDLFDGRFNALVAD